MTQTGIPGFRDAPVFVMSEDQYAIVESLGNRDGIGVAVVNDNYVVERLLIGCLQRGRRATQAGNPKLSRAPRARGRGHCDNPGPGAALRFETPARSAGCWPSPRTPQRPPDSLSNQRRRHPATPSVDQHL